MANLTERVNGVKQLSKFPLIAKYAILWQSSLIGQNETGFFFLFEFGKYTFIYNHVETFIRGVMQQVCLEI